MCHRECLPFLVIECSGGRVGQEGEDRPTTPNTSTQAIPLARSKARESAQVLCVLLSARAITRWDYQPDICKDYKETGTLW